MTIQNPQFPDGFLSRVGDIRQILDALQRLPGAMFALKDLDSRYVYMNMALRHVIRVNSLDEVIGHTDFDLFPRMIAESFRQNDRLVFQHGQPLLNEVHLTCFFNRAPGWSFSSKFPIHDGSGQIIGLIIINELYENVVGDQAELVQLLPAIDYVSKHYRRRITTEELATACGISASHFMRSFKQSLKMTAQGFVEQVRMHHATELLKKCTLSITQVALDCGFYDHSAFVKRFKKFTGKTPLKYRRQHQATFVSERPIILPTPAD